MSVPPELLDNLVRGWNMQPQQSIGGPKPTSVSSALWTGAAPGGHEVFADPVNDHHILSIIDRPMEAETYVDGRQVFAGHHPIGALTFVRAGLHARGVLRGVFGVQHIYLPVPLLDSVMALSGRTTASVEIREPQGVRNDALWRLGREIVHDMTEPDALTRLRIDSLSTEIAIQFLRYYSDLSGETRRSLATGGLSAWRQKRICDYLEDHLVEDVSLAQLAALVDLSPFHLCRAFKQATGMPPHRWRLARRIERARDLLETTQLPITEIAAAVGYDSPGQLANVFRKALGVSPTGYRRERQS